MMKTSAPIAFSNHDGLDLDPMCLPKPKPTKVIQRRSEPKIIDWEPINDEDDGKPSRFGRRKTAPDFERAPSSQGPIFSGNGITKLARPISSNGYKRERLLSADSLRSKSSERKSVDQCSNFDPMLMISNNLREFVYKPIPEDYASFIQCSIRRDRDGFQKNLFPTYYLHAERPMDGRKFLLLAAQRVPKVNRTAKFIITTNIETLSQKSHGDGYVGKLRGSNLLGTEYTLYDNGVNPQKFESSIKGDRTGLRRELGSVIYNSNFLGFKGPRQINVLVPSIDQEMKPMKNEDSLLDLWHNRRFNSVIQLRNRTPRYDKEEKSHMLEFANDRVGTSSVKNFQLIMEMENHKERIVMQFGRINDDTFTCDYRYPLSAIQAFGIALSVFDDRLTRE